MWVMTTACSGGSTAVVLVQGHVWLNRWEDKALAEPRSGTLLGSSLALPNEVPHSMIDRALVLCCSDLSLLLERSLLLESGFA